MSHYCSHEPPLLPWATTAPMSHHCSHEPPLLPWATTAPDEPPLLPWATTAPMSHHCSPLNFRHLPCARSKFRPSKFKKVFQYSCRLFRLCSGSPELYFSCCCCFCCFCCCSCCCSRVAATVAYFHFHVQQGKHRITLWRQIPQDHEYFFTLPIFLRTVWHR